MPPDAACVARSHFGAFPPARGAPEVPLDVACLYSMQSLMLFSHTWCFPDVACVARSHFGAFPPARGAPEVPPDVFLIYRSHAGVLHLQLGIGSWSSGPQNCSILIKGPISGRSRTIPKPFGFPNGRIHSRRLIGGRNRTGPEPLELPNSCFLSSA